MDDDGIYPEEEDQQPEICLVRAWNREQVFAAKAIRREQ